MAGDFNPKLGLDTAELLAFIAETQPTAWKRLLEVHDGPDGVLQQFGDRLAKQLDERGAVDVLRHGVNDHGIEVRLAYFKPAHGLTPELTERYLANRLTVTRQLPYEAGAAKTLDLCLFVNGIPVATAELKNPLTHQTVEDAKRQYRTERDPANVTLGRRALVHFAVDPEFVEMTTCLAGPKTRFLPFNRGNVGGKGNPPDATGHRTRYLWEQVWARDAWLDLLGRFIHITPGDGPTHAAQLRNGSAIFPRYHQWDAVRRLEAAAREEGPGQSYLVQHSAGSGKSNTIAWLAHRLMSLHGADDRPVFDKVVVITDRVILDRQLQETIYQFEHATGVVARIDQDSAQLAKALDGEQARIVITTLQKFPFILDKVKDLGGRRFAVIVDEAHSSQTGEAAKDLKAALGSASAEAQLALAEQAEASEAPLDPQDALSATVAARGRQPNLSFFAFTATPKARTLELFGRKNADGNWAPFHLYSMRQAIEEGFILDVLANYTTYATYWKVGKAVADDPEYDTRKARRSIARFVSLHPHNLAQKAEIIVEHFREHTRHKIGGKGKAMVVTSSRLHAVRYKGAIDRYIAEHGYADMRVLVAFSGRVDDGGLDFTESAMNGFPESQTATQFARPEYGVLIVAEKFQTGYDQPLLHTMFVDKTLVGLAAVQTLSRLNRIHPEKTDTFVLDFRNEVEAITESFAPWYETTVAAPTDPNLLHDLAGKLHALQVLSDLEVRQAAAILADRTPKADYHAALHATLDPAVDRFAARMPGDQTEIRDLLDRYVRAYSFLSQVVDFGDVGLEALYLAVKALLLLVPAEAGGRLDLGSEVELTHLRLRQTSQGDIGPEHGIGELMSLYGEGKGPQATPSASTSRGSSRSSTNGSGWASAPPTSSSSTSSRRPGSPTTTSSPRPAPTRSRTSASSSTRSS